MANLKEIRNRITSISSTMQITSAMKMVSAAKLRRAQNAVTQLRPYATKLKDILENLSATLDNSEGIYSEEREVKNLLIVGVTSNRGLCGGFNNNVIKAVNKIIADEQYKDCNITVYSIGKKIKDSFKNSEHSIQGTVLPRNSEKIWDDLNYESSSKLATAVMNQFTSQEHDKVIIVYNQFKNAAIQEIQTEQFLPVVSTVDDLDSSTSDYIFEPNKEFIVQDLIPKSLKTQFYKALLDSHASEHGARMTAMHKATDNATDLINDLKLTYNKARQAAITNEILEIVGGAEALKS